MKAANKTRTLAQGTLTAFCFVIALYAQEAPGTVTGTIFDGANGKAIRGVTIAVTGQPLSLETDLDGKYKATLPAGQYTFRLSAPGYLPAELTGVEIKPNAVTDASTVLASATSVTTVEVAEQVSAIAATSESLIQERRLANVVSDTISAEDIRQGVASDAAGALEQVTGVSIVEGGFVYVRGLGERYSSTMLNGAMMPTTEPEKRVVPLDLFPANLIDNIKILKTYNPDLPGEFAGGLVQMQTIEFPTARTLQVGVSVGFNSLTTFDRFRTYPGGARDFFGSDDGTRSLPSAVPTDSLVVPGPYTPSQLQSIGRSFADNWQTTPIESMRPEQTYNIAGGNSWGRIGLVGALTFTNRPQSFREMQKYYVVSGPQQQLFTDYPDFRNDVETSKLGGVLNLAAKLNNSNKLVFRNTLTRDTDKEGRVYAGYQGGISSDILSERLRWVERNLLASSLEGDHAVARLGNGVLRWQFTYSLSNRNEPDLREVFRGQESDGSYQFLALSSSGMRFSNKLNDRIYEPLAEWSQPFFRGKVSGLFKAGFRGTFRHRDFAARRFRYVPIRSSTLDFTLPSNELFAEPNIRPDGFEIRELTRGTDTYTADMDIYAGFAMVDLALGPRWRLVGGLRVEDANILVNTINPLVPGFQTVSANLVNRDPLPAVNAIYSLTSRQNLRAAYSKTVSRPDFRELSPFDFNNVLGGFNTVGNPNLRRAKIDNFDARWEWFPGGNQVIAASYFFKRFDDPIEVTIDPAQELRQSFLNADGALNQGFELEFRRSLNFLSPRLRMVSLQANFTFVDSNVRIPPEQAALLTSKERPLLGQSRYIYNLIAEWAKPRWRSNARFYVNSVSRRITDVGTVNLPDIYQERNTFLDFVYQYDLRENGKWTLRFSAENLGDNHFLWTQGGELQRSYYLGRSFKVGTTYTIF